MKGEKYYNKQNQECSPIPKPVFSLFTNDELHMIYIERERRDLFNLMEQLQ